LVLEVLLFLVCQFVHVDALVLVMCSRLIIAVVIGSICKPD
jgi:hypothetical protein